MNNTRKFAFVATTDHSKRKTFDTWTTSWFKPGDARKQKNIFY